MLALCNHHPNRKSLPCQNLLMASQLPQNQIPYHALPSLNELASAHWPNFISHTFFIYH